jgi:hypothetical protein
MQLLVVNVMGTRGTAERNCKRPRETGGRLVSMRVVYNYIKEFPIKSISGSGFSIICLGEFILKAAIRNFKKSCCRRKCK